MVHLFNSYYHEGTEVNDGDGFVLPNHVSQLSNFGQEIQQVINLQWQTMKKPIKNRYQDRINRVIQFIYAELAASTEADLSLDRLSEIACCSKYHFHRLFYAIVGINTSQFIQYVRLKKASYQLAFQPDLKLIEIALDTGFDSQASFSRAFKKAYQQTPSQFRQQPNWQQWTELHQSQLNQEPSNVEVKLYNFPKTLVAALEHHGDPKILNHTVAQFIQWRKNSGESPIASTDTFGLAYNDPSTTPASEFRFDVCSSIALPVKDNPQGVMTKTIPAGRCAHIVHLGSHDLMNEKIRYLYNHWLIENNEELRDFPCFFKYRNLFPQVAEHELITDIYLPLK
jgi:AraC family transcriptional regulator